MTAFRTDLAMERTIGGGAQHSGVSVDTQRREGMEISWVHIQTESAAEALGKPQGVYWTLTHPELPRLSPEERMGVAREIAQVLRMLLPPRGDVLVLGLGNRRMTADALGDRVVSGVMVTRHLDSGGLRNVCALSPGVLGVTGMETAELALGLTERLHPAAVIVVDALAAMEVDHICTTVQLTDTGIRPGSGVGNHRMELSEQTLHVPVIALGVPMVVYASTIVRDALRQLLSTERDDETALTMAEELSARAVGELVVTPRDVDEAVQHLADMLALAINSALQPALTMDEITRCLH